MIQYNAKLDRGKNGPPTWVCPFCWADLERGPGCTC